jgi:hypothetical protein
MLQAQAVDLLLNIAQLGCATLCTFLLDAAEPMPESRIYAVYLLKNVFWLRYQLHTPTGHAHSQAACLSHTTKGLM